VAEVLRASRRAADLCRQIQAYAGRGQVSSSVVDLNEVVDEMGELLSVSFPSDAEVTVRLASGLPPVWGDVTQIRQVVLNLLTNAADALPGGRGRIRVTTGELPAQDVVEADLVIGERPSPTSRLVHLTVEDDGPGMDEETRIRVFEPFFSTKNVGRGLGLAVVIGIVRSHGGTMELRTSPGAGATFRVALPVTTRAPTPEPAPALESGGRPLYGRVLLADDEEGVRRACGGMLREEGLEVVEVADGVEAVERYRSQPEDYDLVILDVSMPRMDGYETLGALREIRPEVRVILSTGNLHDADEVEAKFGAPILAKPYGSEELRSMVALGLGRRPMNMG
jgi:CheY-like chemotaxis protein